MNALIPYTLSALTLDSYCHRAIAPISEESHRFLIPSPNLPAFGDSSNGSEPHSISARNPKYKSLKLCEGEHGGSDRIALLLDIQSPMKGKRCNLLTALAPIHCLEKGGAQ